MAVALGDGGQNNRSMGYRLITGYADIPADPAPGAANESGH